jgi:hypothetical protein
MLVFLRTKFNDYLIWQVAAKVAAEPSCVQVRSHDMIFHPIFPCDMLSAKNLLAFYFHQQSDENCIMITVKEIWSDFNWSINLVNILMYYCSLIKSVFFILFISYFPHVPFQLLQHFKRIQKKPHNIWYVFCNKLILPSSCVTQTSIYLN